MTDLLTTGTRKSAASSGARRAWLVLGAALMTAATVVACGGGGGSDPPLPPSAPSITGQPASASVSAGSSASFTVTATGGGLAYQWLRSINAGLSFEAVTGATAATLTINPVDASMDGHRFLVVVQNPAGVVTSNAAVLTVVASGSGKRFVYAASFQNNTIAGFAVDASTGALTPTPGSPYASVTSPALTLHPSGQWLFATAIGSTAGTWVYRIDASTGGLTPVMGSPFATNFTPGSAPVLDPSGRYLAMVQGLGVAMYRFDAVNGTLASTGTLTTGIGSSYVSFSPDSRFAFVRDGTGLRTLTTDPLTLGPAPTSAIMPSGEAFVRGDRLVALLANRSVVSMTIAPTDGQLAIFGSFQSGATDPAVQLVATSDPQCLLLRSREAPSSEALLPVRIDPVTQALTTIPPTTVPGTGSPRYLLMHPYAPFGYLSGLPNALSAVLTPLAIEPSTCAVSVGAGGDFAASPNNEAAIFDRSGELTIGGAAPANGLYVSRIDATTRRPLAVPGSPFAMPALPTSIVLRE